MRTWILMFLCGILLLQQFSILPEKYWIIILIITILFIKIFLLKKYSLFRYVIALLLGFSWALYYVHSLMNWQLSNEIEGKPVLVTGYIVSIPNIAPHRTSFLFQLKTLQNHPVKTRVKLAVQNNLEHLTVGQEWRWTVKLKKIHGSLNPGGFDYESFALQQGIRASGYVVKNSESKLLSNHWYREPLNRIRQNLKEKIENHLPLSQTSPWIVALALGERQNISANSWEILRNTGTNHLMAIAGLHIGFMASFAFFLISFCWRRIPRLTLIFPAQYAGAIAALCMALSYSALAGFSIPTQRACIMLSVALIILIMKRITLSWQTWCMALLLVLLINPLSVLTESFWLSFFSVALIIYGVSGRLNPKNWWWKLGRIQWVIAVGLIPIGIWLFQQCSLVSFLANSIAIPWVGFVIVPLTLLGSVTLLFSVKAGGFILLLADKSLSVLWAILTYFSQLSWASWYIMVPHFWVAIAATIGMVILLLPIGFPGRFFGIVGLLPLIFYQYQAPKLGEVSFTLLDVGQGLSSVVQTKNHVLVFDAGAKLSESYDMGESVVAPFLRSIGIKKN